MSQGRSIIDIIKDPAALDAFLRSSSKSSSSPNPNSSNRATTNSPHSSTDQNTNRLNPGGNATNIFNQNTTNNTNVQITQNTYNFNTNPTVTTTSSGTNNNTVPQQQSIVPTEYPRVVNQTIGSQTNVNVFLNQTVIQQPTPIANTTTTSNNPQQQMFAINIRGNQTLIPLTMLSKLLHPKNSAQGTNVSTVAANTAATPTTITSVTQPTSILQNGNGPILLQNISNNSSAGTTTVRVVRPPNSTSNMAPSNSNGPRLTTPILSKPQTGNIIVQVANSDSTQTKSVDKLSSNSDLTTQLMQDLEAHGKDPEKQIALIDTYLSRMQSSTDKDRDFCTRIIRYRETLSHSIDQARLNGQHRQRFLSQTTTLNTLSSSPLIKREISTVTSINSNAMTTTTIPTAAAATTTTTTTIPTTTLLNNNNNLSTVTQSRSNGTTLIQLPLAKQEELLNAVLKKLRHVNLVDLQAQGILPTELTFEQKLQIQKLDMQIAALPADKQEQFARSQRDLVPKYLAKNAASGLNTTSTLTVNPRTKILLGAPPTSTSNSATSSTTNTRSLRISSADLIGQQLRKDQAYVLKPDFKSRFLTRGDAIKRLTRYHVFTKPASPTYEPNEDECQQFDEVFEIESKRLLNASERLNNSISRFSLSTDQFHNDACDKYLLEKMRLDDLRQQVEHEKHEYETWKKRAVEKQNKPVGVPIHHPRSSSPSANEFFPEHLEPTMSDAAYFELFNSDSIGGDDQQQQIRTTDETQLAINSIVDFGITEQAEPSIDGGTESTNFFFDDLDLENPNPSGDDEASRAVQNLLGFS